MGYIYALLLINLPHQAQYLENQYSPYQAMWPTVQYSFNSSQAAEKIYYETIVTALLGMSVQS